MLLVEKICQEKQKHYLHYHFIGIFILSKTKPQTDDNIIGFVKDTFTAFFIKKNKPLVLVKSFFAINLLSIHLL